ncbi:hypothetical protein AMS68_006052 [Peltaster fructicola]|uniref:Uncharacterized protein n=1 Tax=Peltaster fructicola TaxID=286661 RepID=A0A6H0Y0V1_9PEZI|nr:hypothetical protein AMS68_006052 [Peltaster fructicola]
MAEQANTGDASQHLLASERQASPSAPGKMDIDTKKTEVTEKPVLLSSTSSRQAIQKRVGISTRIMPLVSALISTVISIMLLATDIQRWALPSDGYLAEYVKTEYPSVSVVVQIIGTLLGFLWTYSVTSAFNLTVRSKLMDLSTNVERLRLYVSVSRKAFDLTLPAWALIISVTFYGITLLPTWLWTGCLTPHIVTEYGIAETGTLRLPDTRNVTMPMETNRLNVWCDTVNLDNGTFSNCPGPRSTIPHVIVQNRSYGVGASVGLTDDSYTLYGDGPPRYSFQEIGLDTSVSCKYNTTADWTVGHNLTDRTKDDSLPNLFYAEGRRPNECWAGKPPGGVGNGYIVQSFNATADTVVAFSAGGCCCTWDGRPPYQLAIAAGRQYNFLNNIQCNLYFTTSLFNVSVDTQAWTMSVQSLGSNDTLMTTRQKQSQIEMAMRALQGITQVETTLYTSSVGSALERYMQSYYGSSFDPGQPDDSVLWYI